MPRDPVCGMVVDRESPPAKLTYQGKEYFFCTVMCMEKFQQNPEKYIKHTGEPGDEKEHHHHH